MIVYKYTRADSGIKILKGLQLKVSPPCEFNDPFELTPRSTNAIRRIYDLMLKNGEYQGSFADFRGSYDKVKPYRAEEINAAHRCFVKEDLASVKKASNYLAILCLSRPSDSCLMWTHYADHHKGVALGFDPAPLCKKTEDYGKVRYQIGRTRFDFQEPLSSEWWAEISRICRTKSCDWEYEQEYRMVFRIKRLRREPEVKGKPIVACTKCPTNKRFNFFIQFQPKTLKQVFLGLRISKREESDIKELLCSKKFDHVGLFKMKRHETEFRLCPVQIALK